MRMSSKGFSVAVSLGLIGLVLVLGAVPLISLSGVTAVSDDTVDMGRLLDLILDSSTSESTNVDPAPIGAAVAIYGIPYFADF